jgi:hypothetical protein
MVGTGLSLLRLDVGRSNHLAPLLGFLRDELSEIGRRAASIVPSRSASRTLILGSARPAPISLFSLSITSAGVFLGAPRPKNELAS